MWLCALLFCLSDASSEGGEPEKLTQSPLPFPFAAKGIVVTPGLSLEGWREGRRLCSVKG